MGEMFAHLGPLLVYTLSGSICKNCPHQTVWSGREPCVFGCLLRIARSNLYKCPRIVYLLGGSKGSVSVLFPTDILYECITPKKVSVLFGCAASRLPFSSCSDRRLYWTHQILEAFVMCHAFVAPLADAT